MLKITIEDMKILYGKENVLAITYDGVCVSDDDIIYNKYTVYYRDKPKEEFILN